MQYKGKFKMFLFVLTAGLVSLTGMISWNPVMGQTSTGNKPLLTKATPIRVEAKVLQRSENVSASWFSNEKKTLTYEEMVSQLPDREAMISRKINVKVGGDSNPQSVIIIYDGQGRPRACWGKASACKEVMK